MNSAQCRMARAALRWSLDDLCQRSGVGRATIQRFEKGSDSFQSTSERLKSALESSGKIAIEGVDCVRLVQEAQSKQ